MINRVGWYGESLDHVPEEQLFRWFSERDARLVGSTGLSNGGWLSTVWLIINHQWDEHARPLGFESMYFEPKRVRFTPEPGRRGQWRCEGCRSPRVRDDEKGDYSFGGRSVEWTYKWIGEGRARGRHARHCQGNTEGSDQERYTTWEEARAGHMAMLQAICAREKCRPVKHWLIEKAPPVLGSLRVLPAAGADDAEWVEN